MTSQLQPLDEPSGSSEDSEAGNAGAGWRRDAVPTDICRDLGRAADLVSSFAISDVADCTQPSGSNPLHSDCWAVVIHSPIMAPMQAGQQLRTDVGPAGLDIVSDACLMVPAHLQEHGDQHGTGFISEQEMTPYDKALLQIFLRRALSAADDMHRRVDNVRDAIRHSDSSSTWFTRCLPPI